MLWSGFKAVGRESLRTGGKILTDITDTDHRPRDIIAKHIGESAQNFIQKFCGRVRKLPALRKTPSKKLKISSLRKGHLRVNHITYCQTMAAIALCVSSAFDIFADRRVKKSTFDIPEIAYKPIISVDQRDLEFVIPPDNETYIDLNWQLYVMGQLVWAVGGELYDKD
jgi:hypothetical protein